ncbi:MULTISPECIES: RNA polymerase sigma factor RpoE [Marinobacter]|uniref:RNA polymerase sigma factor RpoE n=1 Tax=Marinobacter TaxID=2742 RepID=UPI001CC1E6E1|nr:MULTISPECIES: RNA polymerase sigma factor RpoE [Marinobacter]
MTLSRLPTSALRDCRTSSGEGTPEKATVTSLPERPNAGGQTAKKPVTESTPQSPSESQTDKQLIQRVKRGDRSAFDLLVLKYQSRVASIISRYTNDSQDILDLTQETFVKAYRAVERFRGDSAFYTWLYRIAVNTAKNFLESRGRRPRGSMEAEEAERLDSGDWLRDVATPEKLMQREEMYEAMQRAISGLPEELRSALLLREYEGLSYEDIARILECPIGTVRSRIFRARDAVDRELAPMLSAD